ncbi:alginate lyase [Neiella marina]|uniref:Alginate lyase n=1 Tax=Neiella holothuriorum TaxID=2870530 RepID=A0ABS7EAQ3_9GAMM|nr:polysaccharide lyase 6 family protein [Neiella holothuriorum]MBW8189418.1 alginate lyase [Neiella holothuriorum]
MHKNTAIFRCVILLSTFIFSISSLSVQAKDWLVKTQDEYQQAINKVAPGDTVVLANGEWQNFEILFEAKGTKKQPITLTAEKKGNVFLTGQSNLRLAGEYLMVSGLVFKNGFTPSSEVISFRKDKDAFASHSRVTEVVIDNYSNPDRFEGDYWVGMYGKHNRFDHNHLEGKRNKGVTLAVRLNAKAHQQNHHRIDHNYFGPRPTFGSNGGETLRIGTSHHSLNDSLTTVENNYFDRCDGEVEIISIKSGKNTVRNNVFFESRGTLTMRHGNGNLIEGNVFFGNGVDHTGGPRVINADQTLRNNYMEGLTGYRFGSGLTVMNGVPNSPINRYHQVKNATIENNTLINVEHIQLAAGADAERSAAPVDSAMQNNLIINDDGQDPFAAFDDISGIKFKGNVRNNVANPLIKEGFEVAKVELKRNEHGLLVPKNKLKAGASLDLKPIAKEATGPSWYPKTEPVVAFESGKVIKVKPAERSIYDAVMKAESGDVLVLADGEYDVDRKITVAKTISVKAANKGKVTINFQGSSLFEIHNDGSLALEGLNISGVDAPDYSGNAMIRTAKWGMYKNYRLSLKGLTVKDLDINHSFHVFDSGARAFADYIDISDSVFSNITGDILRLNKEQDDLGIYNAEYVRLNNNRFEKVEGAIAKVYRGGSDESTFGPHVILNKNMIGDVGNGKRNKEKASLMLHGVQVSVLDNNQFASSAPVIVEHTVGEPKTTIVNNVFEKTGEPKVTELRVKGPHTAVLKNNSVK